MAETDKGLLAVDVKTPDGIEVDTVAWYAMCDLTRANALEPAYKMLEKKGFEVFTPKKRKVVRRQKQKFIEDVPAIHDLLFVHSSVQLINPIVAKKPTLRYRFVRGGKYREATIVRDGDMERFILAVKSSEKAEFFAIDELRPEMVGDNVIVHGGLLDGKEVTLRKMRGTSKKRILVELPGFLIAQVELTDFDSLETVKRK